MIENSALPRRRLGASGPHVTSQGFGCMSLSGVYGKSEDKDAIALVHHVLDRGVNFLDSADMYGWGHNEELLGKALKGRREGVVLATKFGQVKVEGGPNGVDGRPDHVKAACEASLKRLGIETIDLYYQHRVDPKVPIEETVGAMADLVKAGKVRHLGLCEARPETIRRAHRIHPLAAVQTEYSLLYRQEAEETLATTRELGIAFVAYSPLGRSFLAGSVRELADVANDRRGQHPRFAAENFAHNRALAEQVEVLAREKGCTPAVLALAWLLAQGPDIIPIPGTKRAERFDDNLGALALKLSLAEAARLGAVIPPDAAAGTRYPAVAMKAVYL